MATVPHVCRVSKDYTPTGFSTNASTYLGVGNLSSDEGRSLDYVHEGDAVLVSAVIASAYNSGGTDNGTNNWKVEIGYGPDGGTCNSFPTPVFWTSNGQPGGVTGKRKITITGVPIIPEGNFIRANFDKSGTPAGGNLNADVAVQWQRKA